MSTAAYKKEESRIPIDPNVPDLSKSPYVIVIASIERAKATIPKYGLPKDDKPTKKTK